MTNKTNVGDSDTTDVVIVGAGAAGLSAALFLLRARRSTIIFDSGNSRISHAARIHTHVGFEGVTPDEFKNHLLKEIKQYGGVVIQEKVLKIEQLPDKNYIVYINGEQIIAKAIVIATGMIDILPEIPGLKEGWGKDIHVCPCFTGYELQHKKLVVLGLPERIGQLGKFLTAWATDISIISLQEFEPVIAGKLFVAGVKVIKDDVTAIVRKDGKLKAVSTKGGKEILCDDIFIAVPMKAASNLAAALCDVDENGFANTDENGKTSRDGVWVIGNANDFMAHLVHASANGSRAGSMVTDYLIELSLASKMK